MIPQNAASAERMRAARACASPGPQLDDELCFFTPNGYQDAVSPNRADALVWALSELMLGATSEPRIRRG